MANSIVRLPTGYFPDSDRGRPLFNAKIWVGEVDTNPRIVANQKDVTGLQEDGTEVPLSQPIRTSAGGIPVDSNGNVVTLRVGGTYSLAVDDRKDEEVYYFPSTPYNLFFDVVNVKDFGAAGDGVTDDTDSINAAIDYCRSIIVDLPAPDQDYIPLRLVFTGGTYSVSSLNFTEIAGPRNFQVEFQGATLIGNTAGLPIVDMVGSRWIWFFDATIISLESTICKSGIQLGPVGNETCGNNKFYNTQCLGNFSEAGISNYGSETTQYYSCRLQNNNVSSSSYAYYGDGLNLNGYTSQYVTVTRTIGQAVSFTNNSFYSCQLRALSGGHSLFLSQSNGWNFDQGCYFLTFTGAAVVIYGTSVRRNEGIVLHGLFETEQAPGLDYIVEFTGDGTQTSINALTIDTVRPHAQIAYLFNNTGNSISLPNCDIKITNPVGGKTPSFFDVTSNISAWGVIKTAYPEGLNLGDLTNFSGQIIVDDVDLIDSLPVAGSAYTATGANGGYIQGGKKHEYQDAWDLITVTANNVSPVFELNTISSAIAETINTITNDISGAQRVTFRFSGSGSATFTQDINNIRNNSGANVVLTDNQSVTYTRVTGTIWQET